MCASASVVPTTALLTSCGSASRNSERVSSEPTTTTFGVCSAADGAVELRGDVLQVLGDELLEVPLVPRLRDAPLVVASRLILRSVDDLLEPPGSEPEDLAALATDEGDDRAVVAADELRERREVEAAADADVVRHGAGRPEAAGRSRRTRTPRTRVHLPG